MAIRQTKSTPKRATVQAKAIPKAKAKPETTTIAKKAGPAQTKATATKRPKTTVHIRCDVGFENELFVRGEGAGLSWTKGKKLRNVGADEWVWESRSSFENCQFKVLINDSHYELGENHSLSCGHELYYTPRFD